MKETFNSEQLSLVGLNLQAVINIKDLPQSILEQLSHHSINLHNYTQLVLIGHVGKRLWQQVKLWHSSIKSENPIDDFSDEAIQNYFEKHFSNDDFELVFPYSNQSQKSNSTPIGLQALGEVVGWHHSSPFRVGINEQWGSWFAYRAVVLVRSDFKTSETLKSVSPCHSCDTKPCESSCPPNALDNDEFNLKHCIDYRKLDDSLCKDRCIARMSCPVATEQQYELEQIQYHYSHTMNMIKSKNL